MHILSNFYLYNLHDVQYLQSRNYACCWISYSKSLFMVYSLWFMACGYVFCFCPFIWPALHNLQVIVVFLATTSGVKINTPCNSPHKVASRMTSNYGHSSTAPLVNQLFWNHKILHLVVSHGFTLYAHNKIGYFAFVPLK